MLDTTMYTTSLPRRKANKSTKTNQPKVTAMKDSADNKTLELPIDMIETEVQVKPQHAAPAQPAKWTGATSTNVLGTQKPAATPTTMAKGSVATWPSLPIPEKVDPLLTTILSWPRRHGTDSEAQFGVWLVDTLNVLVGARPLLKVVMRAEGAITLDIPMESGADATTLFSCHIDTVDSPTMVGLKKALVYDNNFGHIMLAKDNKVGSCLGADDGIGVWLMLKMIEAGVPGGYVFNRGEEVGGVSAKALADKDATWLKNFQVAVSFDRPRDNEVITHQRGGTECASDKFALALCTALNKANDSFEYKPSKSGVYTDTYEWRGIIAECVNLGVGYTNQHGSGETQDYAHAVALLEACKTIDWEALPIDREPKIEHQWTGYGSVYNDGWSGSYAKKAKPKLPPAPASKGWTPPTEYALPDEPELNIEDEILELGELDDLAYWLESEGNTAAQAVLLMAAELKGMRAEIAALRKALKRI